MKETNRNTWEDRLTIALLLSLVAFLSLFILLFLLAPFFIHFNL